MEAKLREGEEVALVGGGNSAGQAVVFLAPKVKRLHLVVRGPGLEAGAKCARGSGTNGRPVFPLETSRPGIFAIGDIRADSTKRAAAAVGEGAAAVAQIHSLLAA